RFKGWGGSQFGRLERKPGTLFTLWTWTNIRCPPPPIGNADQARGANNFFFLFGPPYLLAQGASVRQ
ncbi:MAG: hypothetical protein ACK55Z_36195, partial [bacterium]